ncbi:MAG TPA: bifunctional 4-hydroxy-2-oxoglutarate aldolase/2-dehydro-3-deoxy-phosphogluconate aldolase [Anaerolineales bacterium]
MNILERLGELGVVPVVKMEDSGQAADLAESLLKGGLPCVEITFRTQAAEESIRKIVAIQPDMLVGAGTVLSVPQATRAVEAGARFIVSPGFDDMLVGWCLAQGVPVVPGIATPTEALMAMDRGLDVLKFFPAEALGGIPMLEAMSAALPGVKFIPTGGINAVNMGTWLKLPFIHAVAGSWMVAPKLLSEGAFGMVSRLAAEAMVNVKEARQAGGQL